MSLGRILFTEEGALADRVGSRLEQLNPGYEFLTVKDGARLVSVFARLAKTRRPPVLTVLVPPLKRIDAPACMICIRSIERAVGWKPSPILYFGDVPSASLMQSVGFAAHLPRNPAETIDAEAERLSQNLSAWLTKLRNA